MQLKGENWKPGDHGFESKLGQDSAEHPLKPHIKTQNRAKRCNRLDNRNHFGTRGSEVQILSPRPFFSWSGPETWVTQRTGHMGDTFGPNGFSSGSSTRVSKSKY